jgi:hypothetical protein
MTGLLIFIGLILVILNVLSLRKNKKSFNGVLGNAIENTKDYDIRIGELRLEFSESLLELQSELMHIKEIIELKESIVFKETMNKNIELSKDKSMEEIQNSTSYLEKENDIINDEKISEESKNEIIIDESHNTNISKVDSIKKLFGEGLTVEEISEILHLGKGEVLLIKDLYIR